MQYDELLFQLLTNPKIESLPKDAIHMQEASLKYLEMLRMAPTQMQSSTLTVPCDFGSQVTPNPN